MNHRLLIRVTTPTVLIGSVLFVACLISAWYVSRLEANLASILSQNVTSLEAAQELEIRVRQLRTHCFNYLVDPTPARLKPIEIDNLRFEEALRVARNSARTPEQLACVQAIETGYQQYRKELADLRADVLHSGPRTDYGKLADAHPIRHVTDPCHELFQLNKEDMDRTAQESMRVSRQAQLLAILLGLGGPASGLLIGYNVARGLSRSIYNLSVRVQDMAHRLEQNVASVSITVDGDIENLDQQVRHVVAQVEEVAARLQRHQRDMLRAEQLAAVGQLAASVAHEVRNPLTGIKMLIEAALRPNQSMPLTDEDLRVILGEITRLEQTVQSFLDFARLPSPQRLACDLNQVLGQSVELVRARARQQGVAITVQTQNDASDEASPRPICGFVDPGQMRTVLVNLFLNALDAMPGGGRLEVNVAALGSAGVRITVADTGPGITQEMGERLFTPFASTKATGTGLGLNISQRIIEEHGGTISVHNRPTGGACFTIELPMHSETETRLTSSYQATGQREPLSLAAQSSVDLGGTYADPAGH